MSIVEQLLWLSVVVAVAGVFVTGATVREAWIDWRNVRDLGIGNGRADVARAYLRSQAARCATTVCLAAAVGLVLFDLDRWGVLLFLAAQVIVALDAGLEWWTNRQLLREFRP